MHPPILKLQDYGMDPRYGFLPPSFPSTQLSDPYFSIWEAALANLPELISEQRIRTLVDTLPVLSTSQLSTESEWQRAYSLLCFVAHSYIWGENPPAERLPSRISIPLLEVSTHLGTLPVITYAALCLWNFRPICGQDIRNPDNLVALHTFTGTSDESWFHMISVAVEALGAPIIPNLLRAMEAVSAEDTTTLTTTLSSVAAVLSQLSPLLQRMHENLSPRIFYHNIRPFLAGSRDLPKGIVYEDGSGSEKYHQYGGASAAQSPLFQFCDIVLGIEHGQPGNQANDFVLDMRNYMAGSHRKFLKDVEAMVNVKAFVQIHKPASELAIAYRDCVEMLKAFRNKHIGIVTRYIVLPSKGAGNGNSETVMAKKRGCEEASVSGTAGTAVIPFLKQMRDETRA